MIGRDKIVRVYVPFQGRMKT